VKECWDRPNSPIEFTNAIDTGEEVPNKDMYITGIDPIEEE